MAVRSAAVEAAAAFSRGPPLRHKALAEEPSLDLDLDLDPASIWILIGWASEPARRNSVGSGWADGLSGGSS